MTGPPQDNTLVRDVSEQMVLLEPDASPLFVLTNAAKRKQPTVSPRFEWVEDNEVALWGQQSAATDTAAGVTSITVVDGTVFGIGDICAVPKAQASNAAPEVFLVTNVVGNVLTISRGIGGSGADTITASGSIKILGSAFAETDGIGAQRYTAKTVQVSYAQIFKTPVKVTHTAASTKQYGAPQGERKYQLVKALIRHRSEIEAAGLWARAQELPGFPSRWVTMGLLPRIATNKTDGSTTLTLTAFNTFGETAFRWGEKQKLFLCAPKIISALNFFSQNKLLTRVGDTVFGVKISRFSLALGEFLLANDYRLSTAEVGFPAGTNNFSSHAYSIDLPSVAWRYLQGGGDNLIGDTKLFENVVPDGSTTRVDEYRTQGGWEIRHERKHAWLFDVSAYA
jgi:hypothetical protein